MKNIFKVLILLLISISLFACDNNSKQDNNDKNVISKKINNKQDTHTKTYNFTLLNDPSIYTFDEFKEKYEEEGNDTYIFTTIKLDDEISNNNIYVDFYSTVEVDAFLRIYYGHMEDEGIKIEKGQENVLLKNNDGYFFMIDINDYPDYGFTIRELDKNTHYLITLDCYENIINKLENYNG